MAPLGGKHLTPIRGDQEAGRPQQELVYGEGHGTG